MLYDRLESVFWATRIAHEEPKVAELIVDGKGVATEPKVQPHLSHMVCDAIRDRRSGQTRNVLTKPVPPACLWKLRELSGAILHRRVEKRSFHDKRSRLTRTR